jgi:alpha/beta superfamily hydrolase
VAQTLAKTFFTLGYAALRFNFRGVGQSTGSFDDGQGETDDALAALRHARERFDARATPLPIVLAGFSFGSYVQTRVARAIAAERLVLVGPAVKRFAIESVPADTIVVHGEHDDVVPLADVLDWARPQELPVVVFPGCGHFFHGRLLQLQRTIAGMWHGHAVVPGA